MRIISGAAKGVRLQTPPPRQKVHLEIRPTADRAREALFSILSSRLEGATVLDLYAGTGSLGLEALSRGASIVIFVDNNPIALEILQKNTRACLQHISHANTIRTVQLYLPAPLPYQQLPEEIHTGFDLIFADPPYGVGLAKKSIENIAEQNLLKKDAFLIMEERRTLSLPEKYAELTLRERRVYGDNAFHFYQRTNYEN